MKRAFAALALVLAFSVPAFAQLGQSELEERLTCQCGCGLTVHTCNHLQCSFGVPVKEDIAASLAKGEDGEEILDRYVSEYGEKVLSSPTTTGFNLLAWTTPYMALTFGGFFLFATLRRLARVRVAEVPSAGANSSEVSSTERDRLARALEELDQ
ncbi:MAG: cytochrome c-type biogenesis protein CcmH/NrfF [Hyphomicrobiaceae bacterium]|jgi:cytochrome c-type biogenesis protein CcmH/NrfF